MRAKTKRAIKKISHILTLEEDKGLYLAVYLSSGEAGDKVKKEWSMSSGGTDLIIMIGSAQYRVDLMPLLRKALAAEGVR